MTFCGGMNLNEDLAGLVDTLIITVVVAGWWQEKLRNAVEEMPSGWLSKILEDKKYAKAK